MPSSRSHSVDANDASENEDYQALTKLMATDPKFDEASKADAAINHGDAIDYWSKITPDDNGVLGGYPQVSRVDLQGSSNFLSKLRRKSALHPVSKPLGRVVDCGAGIGRITKGFLGKVSETVDIVEPVTQLTDIITKGDDFKDLRDRGVIGTIFNVGLQDWTPAVKYDMIWNQWCLNQLKDTQLVEYFARIKTMLTAGGWIVVKENITSSDDYDIYDHTDSSVTRTDSKFRDIFEQSGLKIIATELQRGMPKELYPVRSYALQPK